jgi:hypothetical protein
MARAKVEAEPPEAELPARKGTGKAPAQPIHREQIENLVSRLTKAAGKLKEIAVDMERQRVPSYDVTNYPTMVTGLRAIEAFKNAAESAWDDYLFERGGEPASDAGETAQMQNSRRAKPAKAT